MRNEAPGLGGVLGGWGAGAPAGSQHTALPALSLQDGVSEEQIRVDTVNFTGDLPWPTSGTPAGSCHMRQPRALIPAHVLTAWRQVISSQAASVTHRDD